MPQTLTAQLKLCLITDLMTPRVMLDDKKALAQMLRFIQQAIVGGVTMIQLRHKKTDFDSLAAFAHHLQALCQQHGVAFMINDHVELVTEINADGAHLGQQDMDVATARKMLGPDKMLGLSIESQAQLLIANQQDDINYVSASAVFHSKTKNDCKKQWGLSGLRTFVEQSRHPVIAIGGINTQNAANVAKTGVHGMAVASALLESSHPLQTAQRLREAIECHL